jgi:hypothetical protein
VDRLEPRCLEAPTRRLQEKESAHLQILHLIFGENQHSVGPGGCSRAPQAALLDPQKAAYSLSQLGLLRCFLTMPDEPLIRVQEAEKLTAFD